MTDGLGRTMATRALTMIKYLVMVDPPVELYSLAICKSPPHQGSVIVELPLHWAGNKA
jgi:hypothetical protein